MNYFHSLLALNKDLAQAPETHITSVARKIIEGAKRFDLLKAANLKANSEARRLRRPGPNDCVDNGVVVIRDDEEGAPVLYALGILRKFDDNAPASCGGFVEDDAAQSHLKEFFEEMISGSVALLPEYEARLKGLKAEAAMKFQQVKDKDPGFLNRLGEVISAGRECFSGVVLCDPRNTKERWIESHLSWFQMDEKTWAYIRGENPAFDYQFQAGDDASEVVYHRLDSSLIQKAYASHGAMFGFMTASFLLDSQRRGLELHPAIMKQVEEMAAFFEVVPAPPERVKTRSTYPNVWVIGATRSCKTAIAEYGVAPLGFYPVSTGDYFRERYGKPDTMSREFVFALSDFSAACLAENPDCNRFHLEKIMEDAGASCVIEGERNPDEFRKLYDPARDMVVFVHRLDVPVYDTVIERLMPGIERIVRENIDAGVTPRESVIKLTFGELRIKGEFFGKNNSADEIFISGPVKRKLDVGEIEDRYPWIGIVVRIVSDKIKDYYKISTSPELAAPQQGRDLSR